MGCKPSAIIAPLNNGQSSPPPNSKPVQREIITVSGNVRYPQAIPWSAELTLVGAISMAGGVGWDSVRRVYIIRGQQRISIDVNAIFKKRAIDPKLQPGDKIEVP